MDDKAKLRSIEHGADPRKHRRTTTLRLIDCSATAKPAGSFYNELKRRRVFRAGTTYLVLAWLMAQIADVLCHGFGAPSWVMRTVLIALGLGLPISLVASWYVDIGIDGIKWESDLERVDNFMEQRARVIDLAIIAVLTFIITALLVGFGMHECPAPGLNTIQSQWA